MTRMIETLALPKLRFEVSGQELLSRIYDYKRGIWLMKVTFNIY